MCLRNIRFHRLIATVTVAMSVVTPTLAAEPRSPDDMGSNSFWSLLAQTWNQITNIVEETLLREDSKYLEFALIVMFGMATLKMVVLITEYIFAKKKFGDLAISISYVLFVFALFKIYGIVIRQIDEGVQGIGSLAQEVALGDNDILSPIKYMRTVIFSYSIESASIFSGPAEAFSIILWGIVLVFIQSIFTLALIFAVLYPIFFLAVLKALGIFAIPMLLFKYSSSYFDSWLRTFIAYSLFVVTVRLILVVLVKMYEIAFNFRYETFVIDGVEITPVEIDSASIIPLVFVIAMVFIATVTLFRAERFAMTLVSGREVGFSQSMQRGVEGAARAVLSRVRAS